MPNPLSLSANCSASLSTFDMSACLQNATSIASAIICIPREDRTSLRSHNANMENEDRNYLQAWREFRHMTQADLAERVGTTASVISLLESGSRRLSPKWLRKLAPALETTPGFLLDHDPNDLPTDILDIWAAVPDVDRKQALAVLSTFRRTGS